MSASIRAIISSLAAPSSYAYRPVKIPGFRAGNSKTQYRHNPAGTKLARKASESRLTINTRSW